MFINSHVLKELDYISNILALNIGRRNSAT
jgi:hypothetical protein